MNDVTKDLLEALEELVAEFGVCGLTEKARAAIARAEAALSEPKPDALEQARAEEREACAKVCDDLEREGFHYETYDGWEEVPAEACHCAAAIRARGEKP